MCKELFVISNLTFCYKYKGLIRLSLTDRICRKQFMQNATKLMLDQNTRNAISKVTIERIPVNGSPILLTVCFQDIIIQKKLSNLALNIVTRALLCAHQTENYQVVA